MSLFRFVTSLFSTRANCEYFVEGFEASHQKHATLCPGLDPHIYLSQAWIAYFKAKGGDEKDPDINEIALHTTYLVACVPAPACARALGLFMFYRERGEDLQQLPHLVKEFNAIIRPVIEAKEAGTQDQIYKRLNPDTKYVHSPPEA
jgi:hypothetical protein